MTSFDGASSPDPIGGAVAGFDPGLRIQGEVGVPKEDGGSVSIREKAAKQVGQTRFLKQEEKVMHVFK